MISNWASEDEIQELIKRADKRCFRLPTWLFMTMAAINVPFLLLDTPVPWVNAMAFGFCLGIGLTSLISNFANR